MNLPSAIDEAEKVVEANPALHNQKNYWTKVIADAMVGYNNKCNDFLKSHEKIIITHIENKIETFEVCDSCGGKGIHETNKDGADVEVYCDCEKGIELIKKNNLTSFGTSFYPFFTEKAFNRFHGIKTALATLITILILGSCSPKTGKYLVLNSEVKGQHQTLTVEGFKYPVILPTCNTYRAGDSIFLDFSRRKFLFK